MEKKATNFCFVKPEDGALSIKITVTDQLKAGGDFKIVKKDTKEVIDQWKVSLDYTLPFEKTLKVPLKELNFSAIVWQVLTCSQNMAVKDGAIKIEFSQMGKPCATTVQCVGRLDNIAPCKIKAPSSYTDSVMAVLKT
jgi:hypothetical protein